MARRGLVLLAMVLNCSSAMRMRTAHLRRTCNFLASQAPDAPDAPSRPAWQRNLPNVLTVGRVIALPGLAASCYSASAVEQRLPAFIFSAIAATDWLDGFLARRWNAQVRVPSVRVPSVHSSATQPRIVSIIPVFLSATSHPVAHVCTRPQSEFGAFLDPVADKLLVCACLVVLSGAMGAVVAVPTAIIVSREIAVSALRE